MAEQIKNDGRSALTDPELARAPSDFIWTEDDEESLRVLKLGGALSIFLLLAYLVHDQQAQGGNAPGIGLHWLVLAATCLFFGLSWTRSFRLRWKFWVLLFALFLFGMFILISRATGDPEARFLAIMLCPVATAAFVSWDTRWQFAMAVMALLSYAAGRVPGADRNPIRGAPMDGSDRRSDHRSILGTFHRSIPPPPKETGAGPGGSRAVSANANRDDGA